MHASHTSSTDSEGSGRIGKGSVAGRSADAATMSRDMRMATQRARIGEQYSLGGLLLGYMYHRSSAVKSLLLPLPTNDSRPSISWVGLSLPGSPAPFDVHGAP